MESCSGVSYLLVGVPSSLNNVPQVEEMKSAGNAVDIEPLPPSETPSAFCSGEDIKLESVQAVPFFPTISDATPESTPQASNNIEQRTRSVSPSKFSTVVEETFSSFPSQDEKDGEKMAVSRQSSNEVFPDQPLYSESHSTEELNRKSSISTKSWQKTRASQLVYRGWAQHLAAVNQFRREVDNYLAHFGIDKTFITFREDPDEVLRYSVTSPEAMDGAYERMTRKPPMMGMHSCIMQKPSEEDEKEFIEWDMVMPNEEEPPHLNQEQLELTPEEVESIPLDADGKPTSIGSIAHENGKTENMVKHQ